MSVNYNSIDPTVIDDDLLRKSVNDQVDSEVGDVARREGIEYPEVTSLRLDYKNILKIDNLWAFENLTKLQLDNNIIEKIENIGFLTNLRWLDLSFNNITKIEGLDTLVNLTDLSLYNNRISQLENMDKLVNLQVFSIGNNQIADLESLVYLTRFENLRVLNASGNPVAKHQDYRNFVLAHMRDLKYLDYRLIDEESIQKAKEKFINEVIAFEEEAKVSNSRKNESLSAQQTTALHSGSHIGGLISLFDVMFADDKDYNKLLVLAPQAIGDVRNDFKQKFDVVVKDLMDFTLKKYHDKEDEKLMYKNCLDMAVKEKNNESLAKLNEYLHFKKMQTRTYQSAKDTSDSETIINSLKTATTELSDFLMTQEMTLVEGFEEVIKEFERHYLEHCTTVTEYGQGCFAKLRELETEFSERFNELIMLTVDRLSKGDMEEMEDEIRDLVSDKDTILNSITGSKDYRVSKLDAQEDVLSSGLAKDSDSIISKVQQDEVKRNRSRVAEILAFIDRCNLEIDNLDEA